MPLGAGCLGGIAAGSTAGWRQLRGVLGARQQPRWLSRQHEERCKHAHTPPPSCYAPPQVYNSYRFGFDRVYGPDSTQEEVYSQSALSAVQNVLQVGC